MGKGVNVRWVTGAKRWHKVLAGYLASAPIPPIAVGALHVEYENPAFWLAQLYGLPFLPVAELTGSYAAGAVVYWLAVGLLLALWVGFTRRANA